MEQKGYFTKELLRLIPDWESDGPEFVIDGKTVYDDGNEEYIVLLIDYKDQEPPYDYEELMIDTTLMIRDILELPQFEQGDHACTLDKVTHGNSTIIALITCCK